MPPFAGGNNLRSIAIDSFGNTYSAYLSGYQIIKTTPSGASSLLLTFNELDDNSVPLNLWGLAVNSNILYIAASFYRIFRYNLTTSQFIAPIDFSSSRPGLRALTFDSQNNMYVQRSSVEIYKRDSQTEQITTILFNTSGPSGTSMGYYRDSLNNEYIYYTEVLNYVVNRTLVLQNGVAPAVFVKERIAGTGVNGYSGDGGPALQATFRPLRGVAVDTFGNVIIMDNENNAIRYIPASTGIIHTICGGSGPDQVGPGTNGVVGTASRVNVPWAAVFKDPSTAYFTDSGNNTSRVLNLTGHY
jgi:hypothetical protein